MMVAMAIATIFGASALDYTYSLMVNLTDGSSVEYKFADTPSAVIEGDNFKIATLTSDAVLYPIDDIVNITLQARETGKVVTLPENTLSFGLSSTTLEAFGLQKGQKVSLYSVAGLLRAESVAAADGTATIDISGLEKGVYLVKAGDKSFKFIR